MFSSQAPSTKQPKMNGICIRQESRQNNIWLPIFIRVYIHYHCFQLDSQCCLEKLLYFSQFNPSLSKSYSNISRIHNALTCHYFPYSSLLSSLRQTHPWTGNYVASFSKSTLSQSVLWPLPPSSQEYYRINYLVSPILNYPYPHIILPDIFLLDFSIGTVNIPDLKSSSLIYFSTQSDLFPAFMTQLK